MTYLVEPTQTVKPRVLHILTGEFYAGIERVVDLLGQNLPDFGFNVDIVCLKPDQFPIKRQAQGICLYPLPMQNKFDVRPAVNIAQLVRQREYQLLHTHTVRPAMIGRLASTLAGIPMIHHFHSPTANDTNQKLRNKVNAVVERYSLIGINHAIAVSESLKHYAQGAGVPKNHITVVPNGVPTQANLPDRPAPQSSWKLGFIALFRPRKGFEILLEAMAILQKKQQPVQLIAVGTFETDDYEIAIKTQAKALGLEKSIIWRGFQENVNTELAKMDLLVLPSLFGEGLPMVVLEAMAAGVPVLSTNVEGIPEVIHHGVDGLIVEPGNPQGLADNISNLISRKLDWHDIRQNAFEHQTSRYSATEMAQQTAQIYQKVLSSTTYQ